MKRLLSSAMCLWSVLALTLLTECALAKGRVALVVGNAKYQKINFLVNPANDAPDIAESLRRVGFDVIIRTDVDKGGFDRALAEFARKVVGSDAALFYYAGHGVQSQKQNYLLPIDIQVEDYLDVEFQAVNMTSVMAALELSTGVKILILDACRDNPLNKRVSAASRAVEPQTRGLARIDQSEGFVIAYATSPDQVAQDGVGRNSPFTEAFVRRLAEPGLEIATLFRRVTQDVYERTNGQQRPEVSISLLGDFYLNLTVTDSMAWGRIRDSNDPVDFQNFIQKYPASAFVRDAQHRLDLIAYLRRENEERIAREQEQAAREGDRLRREALEQESLRLEAQRKQIEGLEAERIAAERKEANRLETERREAEQREALRRDVETVAAQKRMYTDRLAEQERETDRVAAEQREADRREVERIATQNRTEGERPQTPQTKLQGVDKQEAASLEADRREVERLAAARRAQRLEAMGREAERLNAAIRELDRREVERLAAQKRREAERADETGKFDDLHLKRNGGPLGLALPDAGNPSRVH